MNNKYMGLTTPNTTRMVAAPNQQMMMRQQHLGMLQTSFITKAERKHNEWLEKMAEAKRREEKADIQRNAGQLKQGLKECASASFKIAHISSKIAGEEIQKAAVTHGPALKQEVKQLQDGFKEICQAEKLTVGSSYDQAVTGLDMKMYSDLKNQTQRQHDQHQ